MSGNDANLANLTGKDLAGKDLAGKERGGAKADGGAFLALYTDSKNFLKTI